MVPSGWACPLDIGVCFAQDAGNNSAPFELPAGALCPAGNACYKTLADDRGAQIGVFEWIDTFNGTAGGFSKSANAVPADPGSGAGGITIISINGIAVPEPSSLVLMVSSIGLLWLFILRLTSRSYRVSPSFRTH
jgi:hypothetical protein